MAQITGAVSARNAVVEISTDGSTWTDVSGAANKVDPGTTGRDFGETNTFDGDSPIVTSGKKKSVELSVSIVYTEGGSDAFEIFRSAYENQTDIYLRYSPKGSTTGYNLYTSSVGKVFDFMYPAIDAGSAAAIMVDLKFRASSITKSTRP